MIIEEQREVGNVMENSVCECADGYSNIHSLRFIELYTKQMHFLDINDVSII